MMRWWDNEIMSLKDNYLMRYWDYDKILTRLDDMMSNFPLLKMEIWEAGVLSLEDARTSKETTMW